LGSETLIKSAINVANKFQISERVISISMVALGTSIPELAASVIAVLKKEKAISLGNLVGSNIFNLLAVLGITSMIVPIQVIDQQLINSDVFWMLGVSVLIFPLVFFPKGMRLSWPDGLILLAVYSLFIYNTIQ
jgi:cation:H+ antiporter